VQSKSLLLDAKIFLLNYEFLKNFTGEDRRLRVY